ncbi:pheromone/general odorant binding protein [Escherichia coli]
MASTTWRLVFIVCAAITLVEVGASQSAMAQISKGFMSVMKICVSELGFGDHIYKDFQNFWSEEYQLVNRDMGCVVMCMVSKLDLIGDDNKMHHGNAQEFAKKHGADDVMAKQVVTVLHECENTHASEDDPCIAALEISKCFRTKIHDLKWAPTIDILLEEVMTDVKT